jgi:hypothetical protein
MNQATPFVVSQFTNPGDVVFRVSGRLDGKRVRKNSPTRAEAEAERQVLEVQRLQEESGIRTAVTQLVEDQLHEAESVFRRLDGRGNSLSFYVEFALANYREPLTQKLLAEAVIEFVAIKDHVKRSICMDKPLMADLSPPISRLC